MKEIKKENYEKPSIELIEVELEQGFAGSGQVENFGDNGEFEL